MDVSRLAARARILTAAVILIAGCSSPSSPPTPGPSASASNLHAGAGPTTPTGAAGGITEVSSRDLPGGGRELSLPLPEGPYTPSAPSGGTDDYHCFLLDPGITSDTFLSGVEVVPGNAAVVHHAILFHVPADQAAAAERVDAESPGQGWTCFGGSGIPAGGGAGSQLADAGWLGAWAPGGEPVSYGDRAGMPMGAGSRVVLQLHYNLLAGDGPDSSGVRLKLAAPGSDLVPLRTVLLVAPVELACTDEEIGPLCDRDYSLQDLATRFGPESRDTVAGLQLLCGGGTFRPKPSATQQCDRRVTTPMTIYSVAGHMHLLGRSIRVTLNPGQDASRRLLDIPVWNFDDQGATPLDRPAAVGFGDVLRVRCTWDAGLRSMLPALSESPPRYVTWGEGTTDEMCLAILTVGDS